MISCKEAEKYASLQHFSRINECICRNNLNRQYVYNGCLNKEDYMEQAGITLSVVQPR